MKSLLEHCKRRGAPLTALPEVGGRKVNLFILYMLAQKMGGGENVTRIQQWGTIGSKLNLETLNNQNNTRELATIYYQILLPYELYMASPEGVKETQAKRIFLHQFLQELLKKVQVLNVQSSHASAQSPQLLQQKSAFAAAAAAENSQKKQQQDASAKVKKPRKPRPKKKTKKELEQERRQQEELQRQQQVLLAQQQQQQKLLIEQQLRQQQDILRKRHEEELKKLPKVYRRTFFRNYVPIHRPIETQNGYDIRAIAQVGEKIDANKPIFLFAPELGTINLQALSMSLKSGISSEVNTALNTLLVTSADALLKIPLNLCIELLDTLTTLGCKTLDQLIKGNLSQKKKTRELYCTEYDVPDMLSKEIIPFSSSNQLMDRVFDQVVLDDKGSEEIKIKVDSLTGMDINQVPITPAETPLEFDDQDGLREVFEKPEKPWNYLPEPLRNNGIDLSKLKLHIPSYLRSLRNVRDEIDSPFTKVYARGAENPQVLLVDQLSTISMIIRNLSFSETNASVLASEFGFRRFISDLLWAIFLHPDKFVFHRKVFNFKKDTVVILSNVSHLLEIDSVVDAFLLLLLVLSFGECKKSKDEDSILTFPEYSVKLEKYQGYGGDVLAKLMSLGSPNRSFIRSVLLNDFNEDSRDVTICMDLIGLYNNGQNERFKLLNDVFSLLISTIPFQQLSTAPTLIEEVGPTISQSITSLLAVVKFIGKNEDDMFSGCNLALLWLTSRENIGSNLKRLSEALSNIAIHTNDNLKHLKVLFNSISAKSLELIRLLVEQSINLSSSHDESENMNMKLKTMKVIASIPNLLPSESIAFSLLTNPMADSSIAREMELLYRLRNDIIAQLEEQSPAH